MPKGDGTGPMGMGALTGGGMGYCARVIEPGAPVAGRGQGRGVGRGRGNCGGGRGWRNLSCTTGLPGWARTGRPAPATPAQELAVLKQQAEQLGHALESIRMRVREVESQLAEA